jgi:hypothetical protein
MKIKVLTVCTGGYLIMFLVTTLQPH